MLASRLITIGAVAGGNVRRTKVHAAVEFAGARGPGSARPVDVAAALDGIAFEVPAEKVYAELVPFGPAYQNIIGSVYLTEDGAAGLVRGAQSPAPSSPLGSPFPLDAAMHAACAWGQRYRGYVAFPVGFRERIIIQPTRPGEDYYCRVLPGGRRCRFREKQFFDGYPDLHSRRQTMRESPGRYYERCLGRQNHSSRLGERGPRKEMAPEYSEQLPGALDCRHPDCCAIRNERPFPGGKRAVRVNGGKEAKDLSGAAALP